MSGALESEYADGADMMTGDGCCEPEFGEGNGEICFASETDVRNTTAAR